MANFRTVNAALARAFPDLDVSVVRGDGYVYFDGDDGYGKITSIYVHPPTVSTAMLIEWATTAIHERFDAWASRI